MSTATTESPATDRTVEYLLDLLNTREFEITEPGVTLEDLVERAPRLSQASASRWIERLKDKPRKAAASRGNHDGIATEVPAGHYAVTGEDGTTDFYRVDRPDKGKWAGYTFVKLQLSDNYENLSFKNTRVILKKIEEAGPREAAIRYGKELGRCSICNRTLTNNDSIARGIGPVCAAERGWM